MHAQDILDRMDEDARQRILGVIQAGEEASYHYHFKGTSGKKRYLSERVVPATDAKGRKCFHVVGRDETIEVEAEKKQKRLLELLETSQSIGQIGSFEDYLDGSKIVFSKECYRIWGFDENEPVFMEMIFEKILPEDREDVRSKLMECHSLKQDTRFSFRIMHASEQIRTIEAIGKVQLDEAGNLWAIFGTHQDITDDVAASQRSEALLTQFQLATELTGTGMFDWNVLTGEVYYSPQWKKLLGYEDRELENVFATWESLVEPSDAKRIEAEIGRYLGGEIDSYDVLFRMKHKSGELIWVNTKAAKLTDNEGKMIRMIGFNRDVTQSHLAQQALEKSQQEYQNLNESLESRVEEQTASITSQNKKLQDMNRDLEASKETLLEQTIDLKAYTGRIEELSQAKQTFLANMSHEIRTPLNGITGIVRMLSKDSQLSEVNKGRVEILQKSAQFLVNVVDDILDFSSLEAGKLTLSHKPFSLQGMLQQVDQMSRTGIEEKGLRFENTNEDGERVLIGDEIRLIQVLNNLLSNARKFTSKGSVRLALCHEVTDDGRVALQIVVEDSGIGMSDQVKSHLFEAFTQGDMSNTKNHKGTGLGLIISKRIIELMGGEISVSSTEGVGTRFDVKIMLEQSAMEEIRPVQHQLLKLTTPKSAILAEDNLVNQMVLSSLLEEMGFRVHVCNNGQEALEEVLKGSFDIIFMDVQMPVMDGHEATRKIRQEGLKLPIVALSAGVLQENIDASMAAGMDDHISKPVVNEQMNRVLTHFFEVQEDREVSPTAHHTSEAMIELERLKKTLKHERTLIMALEQFKKDYAAFSEEVPGLSEQERQVYLHGLKGDSGSIRAMAVYEQIKLIEQCTSSEELKKAMEVLDVQMKALIEEIDEVLVH